MNCERPRVTSPIAKTPAVCAAVTVAPSMNACLGVPFVPTRYAATSAFPWPGVKACAAPQKAAIRSDSARTPRESSPRSIRASKPPDSCAGSGGASIDAGRPESAPSRMVASALAVSSGDLSRSLGYERRASLSLVAGTVDASTRTPSRPAMVTSRQPMRPGNARSRNRSFEPAGFSAT